MTVNHDVTGSSPVGGAKRKASNQAVARFSFVVNISAQLGSKKARKENSPVDCF